MLSHGEPISNNKSKRQMMLGAHLLSINLTPNQQLAVGLTIISNNCNSSRSPPINGVTREEALDGDHHHLVPLQMMLCDLN